MHPHARNATNVLSAARMGDLSVCDRPYSSAAIVSAQSLGSACLDQNQCQYPPTLLPRAMKRLRLRSTVVVAALVAAQIGISSAAPQQLRCALASSQTA